MAGRIGGRAGRIVLTTMVALAVTVPAGAAAESADAALKAVGLTDEQRRRLQRGEIISYEMPESGARELATGVAMFVALPVRRLVEPIDGGELMAQDPSVVGVTVVGDPAAPDSLAGLALTGAERAEAEALLEAAPGTRFNLSPVEIAAFRTLRGTMGGRPAVAAVAGEYRRLLLDRLQAYQSGGLGGIAPYARAGGALTLTEPGAELRRAAADGDLAAYAPRVQDALLGYPVGLPPGLVTRFYLVKRLVQGRPAFILLHQMIDASPDLVIHVERSFYVGHSYNVSQIITTAATLGDGAVLFSATRVSTDELLGLGNQLRRSIGRVQLRAEMRRRLQRFRSALSRPPAIPSPAIQSP